MINYIQENRRAYDQMASAYRNRADKGEFEIYPDIIEFSDVLSKRFENALAPFLMKRLCNIGQFQQ